MTEPSVPSLPQSIADRKPKSSGICPQIAAPKKAVKKHNKRWFDTMVTFALGRALEKALGLDKADSGDDPGRLIYVLAHNQSQAMHRVAADALGRMRDRQAITPLEGAVTPPHTFERVGPRHGTHA